MERKIRTHNLRAAEREDRMRKVTFETEKNKNLGGMKRELEKVKLIRNLEKCTAENEVRK